MIAISSAIMEMIHNASRVTDAPLRNLLGQLKDWRLSDREDVYRI